jgi:hypothetical protein
VVTKGYHNNLEATKDSFVDGWFCTGDVAEIRNNLVYIVDRKKVERISHRNKTGTHYFAGTYQIQRFTNCASRIGSCSRLTPEHFGCSRDWSRARCDGSTARIRSHWQEDLGERD